MTEAEWHTCDDPRPMLEFVQSVSVSERRLRLFILACCRRIWGQREDGPTVVAMQTVERLATRGRGVLEQGIVKVASGEAKINCSASDPLQQLVEVSLLFPMDTFPFQVEPALVRAIEDLACEDTIARTIPWATELFNRVGLSPAAQAELFRDVVRGPFRLLTFRADWRSGSDGAVRHIAEEIDRDRSFDQLPILADALIDAGCDCDEILEHLQAPRPHVAECWVLDLVLGRF